LTRFANGTCLVNIPHMTRITIVTVLAVTSLSFISLSTFNAPPAGDTNPPIFWFVVSVLASSLIGISSGMGETVFIAFLKGYPSHTVGYVSSGTGFAGINGTLSLLVLKALNVPLKIIFLIFVPTMAIYWGSFFWLNQKKKQYPYIDPK